jgi:transmembrane sensor
VARVRVVVTSGAVLLRSTSVRDSGGTTLRAGDVGTVQPNGAVSAERGVSAAQELAWMRGELIFRDAAIAEIAADLRRWYGIELRVSDSNMARQHLKMDFKGDPPERVVQAIAAALGGRTERRGDTVVVRPATGEVQR